MKRKQLIIIASSIVGLAAIYIIINRMRQTDKYKKLTDSLKTGEGSKVVESGDFDAFDPKFWKTVPAGTTVWSEATSKSFAQKIDGYIGTEYSDSKEEELISFFETKFKNQTQVSRVADEYYKLYKTSMKERIKSIDLGGMSGWFAGEQNDAVKIFNMVSKLPKY